MNTLTRTRPNLLFSLSNLLTSPTFTNYSHRKYVSVSLLTNSHKPNNNNLHDDKRIGFPLIVSCNIMFYTNNINLCREAKVQKQINKKNEQGNIVAPEN